MKWLLRTGSALITSAFCVVGPLSSCEPGTPPGDAGTDSGGAPDSGDTGPEDAIAEATPGDASEPDESGSGAREGDASSGPADAATSEDAEAGSTSIDAPTDAPTEDAASGAGLVCSSMDAGTLAQPATWCVDGAPCTPANQCHVGSLSCATLTCVDTGTSVADGTTCSSGTCQGGGCSEVCSGPYTDCTPNPCVYGSCNAASDGGICQTQPSANLAPNGTACGSNAHQVCERGACAVIPCLTNTECGADERCDAPPASCTGSLGNCAQFSFRCVSDPCMSSGVTAPDGTKCGPDSLCSGGVCAAQLTVTATNLTFTPGAAFTGTLANVTDNFGADTASSLTATIDWGDGTVTAGTASGTSSPFILSGSHTYAARTAALLTATVTDPAAGTSTSTKLAATVGAPFITEFAVFDGVDGSAANTTGSNGIAVGSDGNLWFTYSGDNLNNIDRMTPTGVVTQFAVPSGDPSNYFVAAITSGPDGNLWFPLSSAAPTPTNQIVRITTSGAFTAFDIPTPNAYPESITGGPDGNVWFTKEDGHKLGRITPSGTITEFVPPTGTSQPGAVTTGPDGNLWFAEDAGGALAIDRITPSGQITEFSISPCVLDPDDVSFFGGLTAGPDGNLWFTVSTEGRVGTMVGRMSTTGAVSTFALPLASSGPGAIAAGPDGNLWLVDSLNNTIDRVTPTGEFSVFVIPTANSNPSAIVSGPDGRMWFSEGGQGGAADTAGNIGAISPP
jgi:virginiamycin B lyase